MAISGKYDKLLYSFTNVCGYLELQARQEKDRVDNDIRSYLQESKNIIDDLSETVTCINEACHEMKLTNLYFEGRSSCPGGEFLEIPYDRQAETVECLKNIYRTEHVNDNELINEPIISQEKAAQEVIKTIESNIFDLEDFEILKSL